MTLKTKGEIANIYELITLDPEFASKEAVAHMLDTLQKNYVIMVQNILVAPKSEEALRNRIIELGFDPDKHDYTAEDFTRIAKERNRAFNQEALEKFKTQFTERYYDLKDELHAYTTNRDSIDQLKEQITFFKNFLKKHYK